MIVFKRFLLLLLVFGFTCLVNGQSIKSKEGREFFHKIGANLYKPNSKSRVTYRIADDKLFVSVDKEYSDKEAGYTKKENDIIYYYNKETNDIIGYSKETAGVTRYFRVVSDKNEILKESYLATLYNGSLSLDIGRDRSTDYFVEEGFSSEVLGFILFYF